MNGYDVMLEHFRAGRYKNNLPYPHHHDGRTTGL